MKAKQVAVVTPTARERFTAARPMIIIVVFSLLFVIVASMLPKAGYNNAPVGIRNKEGDGARALAQVLGDHGISVREVNAQQGSSNRDAYERRLRRPRRGTRIAFRLPPGLTLPARIQQQDVAHSRLHL